MTPFAAYIVGWKIPKSRLILSWFGRMSDNGRLQPGPAKSGRFTDFPQKSLRPDS